MTKMKKNIKIISYFLLSFLFLIVLFSYFYNQSIKSNLNHLESDVNNKWSEYFSSSTDRMKSISSLIDSQKHNIPNKDEIYQSLEKNLKNRDRYKHECNLNFVILEYDLNKKIMDSFDSTNTSNEKCLFCNKIINTSNGQLNVLIEDYNKSVLYYNKYISIFPNFIIAKRNGFKKKKYFSIKYGINNDDPIIKSKELPKWAIGVDAL